MCQIIIELLYNLQMQILHTEKNCEKYYFLSAIRCIFFCEIAVIYSVTPDSGPSRMTVVIDTTFASPSSRRWQIRIYQYECSSLMLGESLTGFWVFKIVASVAFSA